MLFNNQKQSIILLALSNGATISLSILHQFKSRKRSEEVPLYPHSLREKKVHSYWQLFGRWTGVDNFKTVHYLKLKVIPKSIIVFILGAIPCCYYLKPLKWLIPVKDLSKVSDCIATTASFTPVSWSIPSYPWEIPEDLNCSSNSLGLILGNIFSIKSVVVFLCV